MKEVPTDQRLKDMVASSNKEKKALENIFSLQDLRDKQRLLPLTVLAAFNFIRPPSKHLFGGHGYKCNQIGQDWCQITHI